MVGVADVMTHPATLEESRINIVVVRLALSCLRYEPMSELCCVRVMLMQFLKKFEVCEEGSMLGSWLAQYLAVAKNLATPYFLRRES